VVFIKDLFGNPIFLASIVSFVASQIMKAAIVLSSSKGKKKKETVMALVWSTGGMPSSHSALVTSMAAAAGFSEGVGSSIFVVSLFFALVIMRDALGVRRAAGLQAKALNTLGRDMAEQLKIDWQPVKEIQGHTPLEVVVGGLFGIFIASVMYFLTGDV
jgi:acid phosphatase family membrane protein YuiD